MDAYLSNINVCFTKLSACASTRSEGGVYYRNVYGQFQLIHLDLSVHELKFSEQRFEFARILDVGACSTVVAAYYRTVACSEGAGSGGVHVVAVQANRARLPHLMKKGFRKAQYRSLLILMLNTNEICEHRSAFPDYGLNRCLI